MITRLLAGALLLSTISVSAQILTVGPSFSGVPTATDSLSGSVRTVIDLVAPSNATGIVTSVHVYWSASPCPGAMKIKFFRPDTNLTMVGERGPFDVTSRDFTVTLSPPIAIQKGDVIGVTRLNTCGAPMRFSQSDATYAYFSSDYTGPYTAGYNYIFGSRLALSGTGIATEDILRGVIPVVGSTAGSGGASFKTSLQLLNIGAGSINGKLVFHPASTSGAVSDPTIVYSLGPGQVRTYTDIAAAFGRTGLGSIDLMTVQDALKPLIVTRVFNDAGAAGTSGLTEDAIDVEDPRVINSGNTAYLVAPVDPSRTRFNIGVRTLLAGATFTAVLRDANGGVVRTVTKSYAPTWFEQVDSTTFMGGTPVGANQSIEISVTNGSAIVYGSTTDNVTNDPAIQYASAPAVD